MPGFVTAPAHVKQASLRAATSPRHVRGTVPAVGTVQGVSVPRRRAARAAGAAVVAGLLLAACTSAVHGRGTPAVPAPTSRAGASGTTSAAAPPLPVPSTPGEASFTDCSALLGVSRLALPANRLRTLSFGCAKVDVPLDYSTPLRGTVGVEVVRVHSRTQTHHTGSLLVNPGGPGESGIVLALDLAVLLSDDMLSSFDVIGFDPRGVGLSRPLRCLTDAQEDQLLAVDPDIRTAAGLSRAAQIWSGVAQACNRRYGATLEHFTTVDTARDMDRIRSAVGDTRMNYLGFSYGTLLGATYAHLYPSRIRAMVLDGAVDPQTTGDAVRAGEEQVAGFEAAFGEFAADCASQAACAPLGNVRAAVQALHARANRTPLHSRVTADTRVATGGIVMYAVLAALYTPQRWPVLRDALLAAETGDAQDLFSLVDDYSNRGPDGTFDNSLDMYDIVSCNDQAADPDDASVQAAARRWARRYPVFGEWSAAALVQCRGWQASRHPVPVPSATGSRPILVVGNLHDPATPYAGAVNLARTFTTGVLLSWNGEGHTSYLMSGCIDRAVDAYLRLLVLPAANTTCPR